MMAIRLMKTLLQYSNLFLFIIQDKIKIIETYTGKLVVIYMCVRGIDFASFYDFDI